MTARYNGFFNAKETIRLALLEYNASFHENYFAVLPVFLYPGDEDAGALSGQMETAIKKTSVVITKHSMPSPEKVKNKREEWCRWIDENWLVMGQAYFYKREFKEALERLKFVRLNYPEEATIYYADYWLARTYIEKGDLGNAYAIMQKLEETMLDHRENASKIKAENKKIELERKKKKKGTKLITPLFPKSLEKNIVLTYADLHLRKKEYSKAIEKLEESLKMAKGRRQKARIHFIMAQVFEKTSDNSKASLNYERAMKLSPDYEMAFHARIFRALMYSGSDSRGIRAELRKMLKDDKNIDFLDQIYYALGELDMKESKKEEGIKNFLSSARYSTTNSRQKTRTYHRLGDIYYNDQNFPQAKAFYDSCMTVVTEEYHAYPVIKNRSEGLTDLVSNLNTFIENDSLMSLVKCGEKCYLDKIDDIIADFKEKERIRRTEQDRPAPRRGGGGTGGWYFYNADAMAFGVTEFRKMWGDRVNEDNWRRLNKSQLLTEEGTEDKELVAAESDPNNREYYVKNLPLTDEAQEKANEKIALSLYNLGVIYKERFKDKQKAEYYFMEAVKRYSPDAKCLASSFQLYMLQKDLGKNSEAEKQKQFILREFPESDYAKIIKDPDYLKKKELAAKKQENDYMEAYRLYESGNFNESLGLTRVALEDKDNAFAPKYLLLKAYVLGSLPNKDNELIAEPLKACVDRFPDSEEGIRAKKILDYMRKEQSLNQTQAGTGSYVYNADMEHHFVILYPNNQVNANQVKRAFSDFNNSSFASKGYKVSNTFLNPQTQMVLIKGFKDKDEADRYYKAYLIDKTHLGNYQESQGFTAFTITHKNYATFFLEKNVENYLQFYKANYK